MDWGIITILVAAIFAAMGIAIGYFMAKVLAGRESKEDFSVVEERVFGISEKISEAVEKLKERLLSLKEDKVEEVKKEVEALEEDLLRLKEDVATLPLTPGSFEALERAELLLKELDFTLPSIDTSLLTQIKDNLIILRNDVQTLLQSQKQEPQETVELPELDDLKLSVKTALELSRSLNAALVKGELLGLLSSLKGDAGKELVKVLDEQAISSKELVLILEKIKKELEEVAK